LFTPIKLKAALNNNNTFRPQFFFRINKRAHNEDFKLCYIQKLFVFENPLIAQIKKSMNNELNQQKKFKLF
jgi:hypothetical protein